MTVFNLCGLCGAKFVTAAQMSEFHVIHELITRYPCKGCAGFAILPIPPIELGMNTKWPNDQYNPHTSGNTT